MRFQVSLDELQSFAASFWSYADGAKLFAFHGEMGAGKTTVISALCKYKGIKGAVSSPTFSIINEYSFEEDGQTKKVYHLDLYRLNSLEEIIQAGVEDCLYSGEICFVEWPEKAPELLNRETLHIYIEPLDKNVRSIELKTSDASYV